jgi:hypothetical protein
MFDRTGVPLIPRKTFFENANAVNPKLSPDGRWLAWIAAVEGIMNVWVAPSNDLTKSRTLTRQADRPISELWFARTSAHVLFLKDKGGDSLYGGMVRRFGRPGCTGFDAYRDVLATLVGSMRGPISYCSRHERPRLALARFLHCRYPYGRTPAPV